jgi:DNA-binding FadR family transcriptional regulator
VVEFIPLDSRRKHAEIAEQIRELVFNRMLNPGDRLPPERTLANRFNVSRGAVRDALRHLESQGFLEIRRGRSGGAYLQEMHGRQLVDGFGDMLRLGQVSVEQLLDARLAIELGLLESVRKNGGRGWIDRLGRNVEEAETLRRAAAREPTAGAALLRNLHEFHHLLAGATGNPVFILAVEAIIAILRIYLDEIGHHTCVSLDSVSEHRAVLDAIRSGRLDEARRVMEGHLRADSQRTVALIRKRARRSKRTATGTVARGKRAAAAPARA